MAESRAVACRQIRLLKKRLRVLYPDLQTVRREVQRDTGMALTLDISKPAP